MSSNYPNGIEGLVLRDQPILQTNPGKVFWVNSTTVLGGGQKVGGSDGNAGTVAAPFATIDKAINSCTASRGDIIMVMPGHTETIADATSLVPDVAGVAIIGLGRGTLRPTITMSAVASSIILSAANVAIQNILFLAEHDNTIMAEVTASNCLISQCEFRSRIAATSRQFVTAIDIGGASANDCDLTVVSGCKFTSPDVGATEAILLSEVSEGVIIENCSVFGDFSVAPIHNPTGKVCTNLTVSGCTLKNTQSGDLALELVSACTGFLINNQYATDIAGAVGGVDPGSANSFECFATDAVDVSGLIAPAVAS
jgi:hypothetical protein